MSDEVAKLGFEIESKQVKDATQDLKGLADQADKTGKAVKDAFPPGQYDAQVKSYTQAVKAASAASLEYAQAGQKAGGVTQALEAIVAKTGVSYTTASTQLKAAVAAHNELGAAAKAATAAHTGLGSAIGTIAREAASVAPALGAVGAATSAVVKEHEAHNKALSSLRTNLRGMEPLLNQLGGGLGDVLQYARAARLGLEGLALVAGGELLIALAKVGDEVERTKNRLSGLTGSAAGGAKAYDAIAAAAKATGLEFGTIEGAVEKAILGQEQLADKNVQYANTAEMVAKKTVETTAAFRTFGTILQANEATSEQAKTALNALGDSFAKSGKLTVDAFIKIREASPSTAEAVSHAFGYQNVTDFIRELAKAPISLDEFRRRMAEVAPQVATTFDPEKPKNFTQALDGLSRKWNEFVKDLAKKPEAIGAIDVLKEALQVLPKILEQDFKDIAAFKNLFTAAGAEWDAYKEKVSNAWHNTKAAVETAVQKIIAIVGTLPSQGIAAITSWANSAIAEFNRMAQGAVSAAQQAVTALGSIVKGGGGNVAGLSGGGNPGSTDALGNPMGGSGGSNGLEGVQLSPQGSDAGAPGFDLRMSDLPAFAGGGQFTVAGSGGTDSQVVSFKSTPGEVVTVSTPEQMVQSGAIQGVTTAQGSQPTAVGVVSATPEPAALATVKEITDAIDKSTIDISKKVSEGSDNIVTALTKLTGGVASTTVNPATGLPIAATNTRVNSSGASGGASGGGFTVKGGINPTATQHAKDEALYKQQQAANAGAQGGYGGDPMYARGYGASYRASDASRFPTNAPTGQYAPLNPSYSPLMYGGDTGSEYQPFSAGGGDYYGGDYFGSGSSFSATGETVYGASSGGSNYSSDYGGSTSGGITGFDPNAMNYGGGSVDAGYFATGGSFPVPGSGGGIDKTLVTLHATPGETVTVTPLSSNVAAAANADPSSQANVTNKTININVQAGIQAESFIRSRAMIARGL